MWEYTDKVQQHFLSPHNVGEIDKPSGTGDVGSLACGDALKLTLKIDENDIITDAKFKTFGCASAIASSSVLTEMIKGISVNEAAKITNEDIAQALGGLPKEKMHCSVMGREALEAAIADYRGMKLPMAEGEIVCECFGVTDIEIRRAVTENNLSTIEDVTDYVKAGGGCGKCHEKIQEIIDSVHSKDKPAKKKTVKLTNIQKIKLIEETLEREIKPALKKDGGNIELIDVDGNRIIVKMRGTCATCSKSQITLKHYVESKLRELVAPELIVEEVQQ